MSEAENSRPHSVLLWSLLAVMAVLWTINPLAGKIALRHMPVFLLIAVRTSMAGLAIFPVMLRELPRTRRPTAGEWLQIGLFGLFLQIGNQAFFFYGLSRTSVAHAAFIYALTPITVLLLAAAIGQERFTGGKILGMAMCVAGVMLLTRDEAGGEATALGDSLLLVGITLFSWFTVFGKSFRRRFGPVVMNSAAYLTGTIAFQPVIWLAYPDYSLLETPAPAWAALFYMAVFSAVIGYLIYYWALGHVAASRVATLQYVQPPLATFLGWLFLGESVTWVLAGSGALILAGIFITEKS